MERRTVRLKEGEHTKTEINSMILWTKASTLFKIASESSS